MKKKPKAPKSRYEGKIRSADGSKARRKELQKIYEENRRRKKSKAGMSSRARSSVPAGPDEKLPSHDFEELKSNLKLIKAENEKLCLENSRLRGKNQELELIAFEAEKFEAELSEIKAKQHHKIDLEREVERLQSEQSRLLAQSKEVDSTTETVVSEEVEKLRTELFDIKTKYSTLQKRVDWYEQTRDWVSSAGDGILLDLIERDAAPTPFRWGGQLFKGKARSLK